MIASRRFLRAGLASQGYVVSELEEGLPAVDIARRKGTDLIVLDLGLPDIDGTEVIGRIRAAGSAVPIIVLSSRSDEAAKVDRVPPCYGVLFLLSADHCPRPVQHRAVK